MLWATQYVVRLRLIRALSCSAVRGEASSPSGPWAAQYVARFCLHWVLQVMQYVVRFLLLVFWVMWYAARLRLCLGRLWVMQYVVRFLLRFRATRYMAELLLLLYLRLAQESAQ